MHNIISKKNFYTRLQRNLIEGPTAGPHISRIRFFELQEMILEAFPTDSCSAVEVSRLLHSAFPSALVKRETKGKKETYYIGVERFVGSLTSTESLEDLLRQERAVNKMLMARVQQLEQHIQPVRCIVPYQAEFSLLLSESSMLSSGPNTLENLKNFSLSTLIEDVRNKAPDLFDIFQHLGDTQRNRTNDDATHEDIKALTSLCVLANARSQRVKGLQLFLSIMLIARAVNKQVRYS